jgi:VIT1/CCC1 family predicted Fe2+/Mn2+ transporter
MIRHQASAHAAASGGASPVLTLGDQEPAARSVRVLDPIARASEVLFGLIMALTFTGTLSVATAGGDEVRALLIGMVGCNLAWGLVDAVMFLISALTERGHGLLTLRAVQAAATPSAAHRIISGAVPPVISSLLTTADLERFRRSLQRKRDLPCRAALGREDWFGALAVFLLVFLSTFPLVIPFLLFDRVHLALRVSNAIAIVMLFTVGYWLAQHSGHRPWRMASAMVCLGLVLVGIAIALGG